VAVDIG